MAGKTVLADMHLNQQANNYVTQRAVRQATHFGNHAITLLILKPSFQLATLTSSIFASIVKKAQER